MSMKIKFLTSLLVLGLSIPAIARAADAPAASAGTPAAMALGDVYSLDQFGKIGTPESAQAAFDAASKAIVAAGGGTLLIPKEAPAGWHIQNYSQVVKRDPAPPSPTKHWPIGPGVTVIDMRSGTLNIFPPQQTGLNVTRIMDLPPNESLPHWNYSPMVSLTNVILRGSTSYHDWIQEDVAVGKAQRFYVATVRGLFPGMFINGGGWGAVERLYIQSLGYDTDKKKWYFVADSEIPVKKGTIVSNKSQTPILKLDTYSHDENQTFDIVAWRHNYSQGDNYIMDARFFYQGDNHSTAGDENYVNYAAFQNSDTAIFHGAVAAWDPATGELKYSPGSTFAEHLGSGRPIINLNPKKWITGKAIIVRPSSWTWDHDHDHGDTSRIDPEPVYKGKTYPTKVEPNDIGDKVLHMGGLINLGVDVQVGEECIGRYFAVSEPDELVPGAGIRRWYLINKFKKNEDGTKTISIIRHWWGAKDAGSPTLYNFDNYSSDGHEKPLAFVIAPGSNAVDVSDGVEGPGTNRSLLPESKKIIRLAPYPDLKGNFDFAAGDPVEQAIGPDPFRPVAFRSWTFEDVPGAFPAPFFDINNGASPQRYSVMTVHGGGTDIERQTNGIPAVPATADKPAVAAVKPRYDHKASFNIIYRIEATAHTGLDFAADVGNAAILFEQPHNRPQPIKWRFLDNTKESSLTASPIDGVVKIDAPGVSLPSVTDVPGISGTATRAANLRGIKFPVKAGSTTVTIKFPTPEADADYAVFLELSWLSDHAVTSQTADGITVQFDKAPAADATLHWMIVR